MNTPINNSLAAIVVSLFTLGLGGCGNLVTAEGTVSYDGKPLDNAMVMFIPEGGMVTDRSPTAPRLAQTMTNAKGVFRLNTHNKTGSIPGRYKVVLSRKKYPPEYYTLDPEKDPSHMAKLAALSAQGKETLPKRYTNERETPLSIEIPAAGSKDLLIEATSKN